MSLSLHFHNRQILETDDTCIFKLQTYATDFQTSDSAATATAMVGGEKTINDVVSCNQETILSNCSSCIGNEVKSILHYAIEEGNIGPFFLFYQFFFTF